MKRAAITAVEIKQKEENGLVSELTDELLESGQFRKLNEIIRMKDQNGALLYKVKGDLYNKLDRKLVRQREEQIRDILKTLSQLQQVVGIDGQQSSVKEQRKRVFEEVSKELAVAEGLIAVRSSLLEKGKISSSKLFEKQIKPRGESKLGNST